MTIIVIHEPWCPLKGQGHSDEAKRISDTYNLHKIGRGHASNGKWMACALSDGTSDNVLYDSKRDAVHHQRGSENWFTYIKVNPSSMSTCDAEVMLKVARRLYDKGLRMADPDHRHGGPEVIKRSTVEDQRALSRGLVTNLIIPERG